MAGLQIVNIIGIDDQSQLFWEGEGYQLKILKKRKEELLHPRGAKEYHSTYKKYSNADKKKES